MIDMKRIIALILSLSVFALSAKADDKPIDYEQLPVAAKSFIHSDFPSLSISFITRDADLLDTTYDVHFTNGLKLEFNSKGEWKEISNATALIDTKYIPKEILASIASRWPDAGIKKIERYRQGYEIELTNRLELKYDKHFRLVEIDD